MFEYKVLKKYKRIDNTGDNQEVEYALHIHPFNYLKDARRFLEGTAHREDMIIRNYGLNAEKEETVVDEETGITVTEVETLRIEKRVV